MEWFWKNCHGKVALAHHISKLSKLIQKYKGLSEEVVMIGQGLVPIGHKRTFISNFKIWKWFLLAMSPDHHPQQLIFTKKEYWHKKFVQTCQSSSKHSLDLEARVFELQMSISCSPFGIFE